METLHQMINTTADLFLAKPAQAQTQTNSQGVAVESAPPVSSAPQAKQEPLHWESSYEDLSLGDTPLAGPFDTLYPPSDDSGIEHAIISCGPVLKSTHDLARWSEKTGARRVNGQEAINCVTDLIIGLEAPRAQPQQGDTNLSSLFGGDGKQTGGSKARSNNGSWKQKQPSQIISCGPVLKSTHDAATWSEKSGAHAVNTAASAGLLEEMAVNNQGRQNRGSGKRSNQPSRVINSWPVLKSTHDSATSEKKGTNAVNSSEVAAVFDDVASNQGAKGGSSLQSGFDTQAGSHIQLDGTKAKETPEQAMAELHLHV